MKKLGAPFVKILRRSNSAFLKKQTCWKKKIIKNNVV